MVDLRSVDDAFMRELEERERAALKAGGGDGTSGGVTDDWKESVDRQLTQLHGDFRRLVGWLIAAVAAPLIAVVGLYAYVGIRFDAVEARSAAIERQVSDVRVEQAKVVGTLQAHDAEINGKLDLLLERKGAK